MVQLGDDGGIASGSGRSAFPTSKGPRKGKGTFVGKGRSAAVSGIGKPVRGSNIRQVTQGRSRAITTSASEKGSTPAVAFGKFKGVVSTLGGAKDIKRGGGVLDEN